MITLPFFQQNIRVERLCGVAKLHRIVLSMKVAQAFEGSSTHRPLISLCYNLMN